MAPVAAMALLAMVMLLIIMVVIMMMLMVLDVLFCAAGLRSGRRDQAAKPGCPIVTRK